MNAEMMTRNVQIGKNRTTLRLEAAVWEALDEICLREGITRHQLCTQIDQARTSANRAQAVRAAVVNYYRLALRSGKAKSTAVERALNGSIGIAA